jgi:hypothetical protein
MIELYKGVWSLNEYIFIEWIETDSKGWQQSISNVSMNTYSLSGLKHYSRVPKNMDPLSLNEYTFIEWIEITLQQNRRTKMSQ